MNRKVLITESEKQDILNLHNQTNLLFEGEVVVTDWISEDNRYAVFMDHLFDVENKKDLGDIWKSSDNLFLFLEHAFNVSSVSSVIKEDAKRFFSNRLLVESTIDLTPIKSIIKKHLNEDFWKDTSIGRGLGYTGKFIKDTASSTYKGIGDTFKEAWDGIKKAGIAISKGDFKELLKLIGQGFLWTGRKIRSAAYSTVGLIIDAILIATGIGKIGQAAVWVIIVCVDIYEFMSGNYEDPNTPFWMRILFFGCDVLGLVFAGAAAKAGRVAIKGAVATAKTAPEMGALIAKNPTLLGMLKKMVSAVKDLPATLSKYSSKLGKGFFSTLFKKALDGVSAFVTKFLSSVTSLFTKKEMRPVLLQLGLIGGIGTYGEYSKGVSVAKNKEQERQLTQLIKNQGTDIDTSQFINV
jgi:hypothetical protein